MSKSGEKRRGNLRETTRKEKEKKERKDREREREGRGVEGGLRREEMAGPA